MVARNRYKETQVPFEKAARTATSSTTFACGSLGGLFFINCTLDPADASVVFTIKGTDPLISTEYTILESEAITGVGLTVLRIHPSLTASANTIAKDILPGNITITATHADADTITYAVSFIGVD